jgi:hypothetical protein
MMSFRSESALLLWVLLGYAPPKATGVEVCNLLTKAEIEAVLGEPVHQTKSSVQPGDGLRLTQCFFGAATAAKSVSVALATPGPVGAATFAPRDFWRKQFHPRKGSKNTESEREEGMRKARPIGGLGEEAYWVGNSIAGALYVLHTDRFLRISVGGVRQEALRIQKSKALARAAVKRL